MTFSEYIQGKFPITVPEATLATVMYDREIVDTYDIGLIAEKSVQLAYADICIYFAKTPSDYGGVKDSDNGWSHSESSYKLTSADKATYRNEANAIYRKYGESDSYKAGIRITNLHGTPYYGN